jgi:prepilin-type N-terminal cleavage/methylation domain-containing protein
VALPSSTHRRSGRRAAGFTLVELLVVIAILSGMGAVASFGLGRKGQGQGAANLARGLHFALLEARTSAVSDGVQRRVRCTATECFLESATSSGMGVAAAWRDAGDRIRGAGSGRVWSVSVTTDVSGGGSSGGPLSVPKSVIFYPDGSASASTIYVADARAGNRYRLYVYSATGLSRLAEGW